MTDDDDVIGNGGDVEGVEDTDLYKTLYKHLPNHRGKISRETIDIRKIGEAVGVSYQAVNNWTRNGFIPSKRVDTLCNLDCSTLTREILLPFIRFE